MRGPGGRESRRAASLAAALAASALLTAGCGDDSSDGGESSQGSDTEQVQTVMTAFLEAARSGDGQAACAQVSETFEQALPGGSCEEYFSDPKGPGTDVPRPQEITVIRVEGDSASASPEPGPGGVAEVSYLLERADGEWEIAGSSSVEVPPSPSPAGGS